MTEEMNRQTLEEWEEGRIRSDKITVTYISLAVHSLLTVVLVLGLFTAFAREMDSIVGVSSSNIVINGMMGDALTFGVGFSLLHCGFSLIFIRLATAIFVATE